MTAGMKVSIFNQDTWGENAFYEISEVSDKLRYLTFLNINMLSIHVTDFNYLIWLTKL